MAVCLTVQRPSQHIRAIPEQVKHYEHYSFAMIQKAMIMRHYILHEIEFAGWKHDSVTAHNSNVQRITLHTHHCILTVFT